MSNISPLGIDLLGLGTVGSGVSKILAKKKTILRKLLVDQCICGEHWFATLARNVNTNPLRIGLQTKQTAIKLIGHLETVH